MGKRLMGGRLGWTFLSRDRRGRRAVADVVGSETVVVDAVALGDVVVVVAAALG